VIVEGAIAWLKVAVIFLLIGTPEALLAGLVKVTVGAVAPKVAPVVNLQTKLLASGSPSESVIPVVSVAV
jgi:hypothetical protein